MYGFYRVAAAVPKVRVANVDFNVDHIVDLWKIAAEQNAAVILFPELSVSSYSCGDLFYQQALHRAVEKGLRRLLEASQACATAAIVGAPVWHEGRLYNCGIVIQEGEILGVVPKIFVPEHKEYYEKRWFVSGRGIEKASVRLLGKEVPFGTDLLFCHGDDLAFGVEI